MRSVQRVFRLLVRKSIMHPFVPSVPLDADREVCECQEGLVDGQRHIRGSPLPWELRPRARFQQPCECTEFTSPYQAVLLIIREGSSPRETRVKANDPVETQSRGFQANGYLLWPEACPAPWMLADRFPWAEGVVRGTAAPKLTSQHPCASQSLVRPRVSRMWPTASARSAPSRRQFPGARRCIGELTLCRS